MVNTTLRAYLDELNLLLEQEALDEVTGHCRHILQHYPKNVETYRLLGRALLEKGRHEEAADVFQRVLSSLPDDFVSHLGLSSVAEERNQTPTAIWHLERAYEQDPNNMALQGELKRLYEANGTTPERVQLTQGALIRIYAKGRLYDQANRELQTALTQQPNRLDLLLLQADVLWNSDHPVEAAEISLHILERLPDSLQANRLLASLWLKSGRPSEAEPFVARLEQLDPFLAWQVVHPDGTPVPGDAFQLSQLDWDARAAAAMATDVPDWVSAIPNVFDAPESVSLSGGVTNWLEDAAPAPSPEPSRPSITDWMQQPEPAAQSGVPDWFTQPAAQDTESDAGANMPDWFAEAINTPGEPAAPTWAEEPDEQLPTGFTDLLMGKAGVPDMTTGPASPAGPVTPTPPQADAAVPDWLADVQPAQPAEPVDAMSWLVTGLLPPLDGTAPEAPAEPEPAGVDWLSERPPLEQTPAEPAQPTADLDWLSGTAAATPETPAEPADVDWLSELPPLEQTPAEPEPAQPTADVDWLSSAAAATPETPAEPADVDWLSELSPLAQTPAEPEPAQPAADLDWLSGSAAGTTTTPETPAEPADVDWLSELSPLAQTPAEPEPASAEMPGPDWLSDVVSPAPETPSAATAPEDWLSSLRPSDTGILPPEAEAAPEPASTQPQMPDLDWLSGMSSAAPETPAEAAAPTTDWLSGLRPADTGILPSEAEAAPEPASAQPQMPDLDWLSSMSTGAPETPAEAATSAEEAVPAESGLDWLSGIQPMDQTAPTPVDNLDWLSAMPGDVSPAAAPSDLFDIQGESQESLPEEWLSDQGSVSEDTGIVTEGDPMAWLRPYTEEGTPAEEPAAAESAQPSEAPEVGDETPAWLSSMMPSTPPGPANSAVPLDDLDFGNLEPVLSDEQEQPAAQPAQEDWLSTSGETPAAPVTPSAPDWLSETPEPADEHPLELEDDWLASFEIGTQPQAEATREVPAEPQEPAAASADWLGSLSLEQPGESAPESADWLGSRAGEPEPASEPSLDENWMASLNIPESAPVDETPAWIDEPAPAAPAPDQPDWLATPEAKDHFDSLIKHAAEKANEPRVIGDTGVLGTEEMPDWLSALGENAEPEQPAEAQTSGPTPDWLGSTISPDTPSASSQAEEPAAEAESAEPGNVPDWLTSIAPAEKPADEAAPLPLDRLDFGSLDTGQPRAEPAELALPANMVNTNVSVPADQSRFTFSRPPAWLRKKKSGQGPDAGDQPQAEDLPDWLRG